MLDNVFNNVPLAFRLAVDQLSDSSIDKSFTKGRRIATRRAGKEREVLKSRSTFTLASSNSTVFDQAVEAAKVERDLYFPAEIQAAPSVRLLLPLQPEMPDSLFVDVDEHRRLLDRHTLADLREFAHLQTIRGSRIRGVLGRLELAGCAIHRREVVVDINDLVWLELDLQPGWTVPDVRQALGLWDGEEAWYTIVELQECAVSDPTSPASSISSDDLTDSLMDDADSEIEYDQHVHDSVAHHFRLPTLFTSASSNLGQNRDLKDVDSFLHTLDSLSAFNERL